MYFSSEQIAQSLKNLSGINPFFGMSFLVFKKEKLPIGKTKRVPINKREEEFLSQYYKPFQNSKHFFQPFYTSHPGQRWLATKYPSSGLQKLRTQGPIADSLTHTPNLDDWGWKPDYIEKLASKLKRDRSPKIPAYWLAVWLFRNENWEHQTNSYDVINFFLSTFNIIREEKEKLFDLTIPNVNQSFSQNPISAEELKSIIGQPPDVAPERGGSLHLLQIEGTGPITKLEFEPASRLSVITGDNGVGKSFILDCAWWCLTGNWISTPALPRQTAEKEKAKITFQIGSDTGRVDETSIVYDWTKRSWPSPKTRPTVPGLVVYARVDGSFAVWDPLVTDTEIGLNGARQLIFTRDNVLDGLPKKINGLILDWIKWQNNPDQSQFEIFTRILKKLSPPDFVLTPGRSVRIPNDSRDIPTIHHSYDEVPIIHESAGVRRILSVGYLIAWAWYEHNVRASLSRREPERRIVMLIDEVEAHLHPKWQRSILPAVLEVSSLLSENLSPQIVATTHSPMVLASLEQSFNGDEDKLFHIHSDSSEHITFKEITFIKQGNIDTWLTSEIFELREPTSMDTEAILTEAKKILGNRNPDKASIATISRELASALPPENPFWVRWIHFASMHGVDL
jgi:hypothetical protein